MTFLMQALCKLFFPQLHHVELKCCADKPDKDTAVTSSGEKENVKFIPALYGPLKSRMIAHYETHVYQCNE